LAIGNVTCGIWLAAALTISSVELFRTNTSTEGTSPRDRRKSDALDLVNAETSASLLK